MADVVNTKRHAPDEEQDEGPGSAPPWQMEPGDGFGALEVAEPGAVRVYDLAERTARFGEAVIDFAKAIPVNPVTRRLIDQLVGAATSIGANYCEADDAVSRKDFRNRIGTCKKEAREAKFFLRMVVRAVPEAREQAVPLWQEAKELHLIFARIFRQSG